MSTAQHDKNRMLESAVKYAGHGWPCFPTWWPTGSACNCSRGTTCVRPGKHPLGRLVPNGLLDATTDLAIVEGWWRQYPQANIGIRCGVESGLVVVDVDAYKTGVESLDVLESKYGKLPYSIRARTGSGGGSVHIYLAHPGGDIRLSSNSSGKFGPGLDIKADGGYVIAPPGLHYSGGRYTWLDADDSRIEPAPSWLITLIGQSAAVADAPVETGLELPAELAKEFSDEVFTEACGRVGNGAARHDTAVWFMTQLKDNAVPIATARTYTEPYLDLCRLDGARTVTEDELNDIINWAYGKPRRNPYPRVREALERLQREREAHEPLAEATDQDTAAPIVLPAPDAADWRSGLLFKRTARGQGTIECCLYNASLILRRHEAWTGKIRWNSFASQVELQPDSPIEAAPGAWTDLHTAQTVSWLQSQTRLMATLEMVHTAIQVVGHTNSFNPVHDYLNGLVWDQEPRLNHWLEDLCGAARNIYTTDVGRRWLISAVARVMQPGCKADHALILEGPQGAKKSTLFRTLFAPWFTDQINVLGSKDAAMQIRGVWCVEMAELDSMHRSDISSAKAFITSSTDRYRPPYGREVVTTPRTVVFAGSTNRAAYLSDETGGRRFWCVKCGTLDPDTAAAWRDNLWAEALHSYKSGEKWWITEPLVLEQAMIEQEERFTVDAIEERIEQVLSPLVWKIGLPVTTFTVMEAIGWKISDHTRANQMRTASCLARLGYEKERATQSQKRVYLWSKKSDSES